MVNHNYLKNLEFATESIIETKKFKIIALKPSGEQLILKNTSIIPNNDPHIIAQGDAILSMRYINPKKEGIVEYALGTTTQTDYQKGYRLTPKDKKEDESIPAPTGGCIIGFSKDGLMVFGTRETKNEYCGVIGALGKIIGAEYDYNGTALTLEDIASEQMSDLYFKETGIPKEKTSKLELVGVVLEIQPKFHSELTYTTLINMTGEEIRAVHKLQQHLNGTTSNLVTLPATIETVEKLLTKYDAPIPPSHEGALLTVGYQMAIKKYGSTEDADAWMRRIQPLIDERNNKLDETVHNATPEWSQYSASIPAAQQHLKNPYQAMYEAGLLRPSTESEMSDSPEIFRPDLVSITGGIHYPNYPTLHTNIEDKHKSDKVRGDLTIDSIINYLTHGYNVAVLISGITPKEYVNVLRERTNGLLGKLKIVDEPKGTAYGTGRQLIAKEAIKEFPNTEIVFTLELEKPLEEHMQNMLQAIEPNTGLVFPSRNGLLDVEQTNIPFAQFIGEVTADQAMSNIAERAGMGQKEFYDLLNGTRGVKTKPIKTIVNGTEYEFKPIDIFNLVYEYPNGDDPGIEYGYQIQHYGPIYNSAQIMSAFKIGIKQVEINYRHPEEQRQVEESPALEESFSQKRTKQRLAITKQTFDIYANILTWMSEGLWPDIILESINNGKPLSLRHFDPTEYKIESGKLTKRQ